MAGRIRDEDIAEVREKARIDEVVSDYVTLRNAGGGSQKGLCPFHDEKSPSFHVTPSRGFYHCFGCGAGGDVISFLMEVDGLGFTDTVERLAQRFNVELRLVEGDAPQRPSGPQRSRLVEAHKLAQELYADRLGAPEAQPGREFLTARGFDADAAATFGVGFSPKGGDELYRHLRGRGFTDAELVAAGLCAQGNRGHYDRFRGRLMWPIRETNGDTIGFGARRILDDDRIDAKYLNTPETTLYKKSHVLYGIDLARREIARSSQAVVVEGYTDVMACQLAGVGTAVATCGTAFGEDHGRVLRRLLHDHEEFRGEVIFTFDGDEAGQRAALKAFNGDAQFVSQTYVAVEPGGLDPCDLRLRDGDAAVRELVARRVPLYRFVLGNVVGKYDLDRADGRIDAVREAARLVASVRDSSKVTAFAQEISRMIGSDVDTNQVLSEVRRAASRPRGDDQGHRRGTPSRSGGPPEQAQRPAAPPLPDLRDPRFSIERESLKLVVQHPLAVGRSAVEVDGGDFLHPTYRALWEVVASLGGPGAATDETTWAESLRERIDRDGPDGTGDPAVASALSALATEPVRSPKEPDRAYAVAHISRLQELTALRRIAELKSRLQRTNPVESAVDYNRMFGDLVALEQKRRDLRERAVGGV